MEIFPGFLLDEMIYEDDHYILARVNSSNKNQKFLAKKLKSSQPSTEELANFHHEVRILKEYQMEGIPKVLSHVEESGIFTILSEDFDGVTLQQYLREEKVSILEFLEIGTQLCEIIGNLHRRGLIHKNINPFTILISKVDKKVKLVDFSSSSNAKNELAQSNGEPSGGQILPYKSPEQSGRTNQSIDHRSDFYSLGVVFYQLASSRLPFDFEDILELTHAQIARIPESPSLHNPTFPEALSKIILKLLAKSGDDRYQSTDGIQHDLLTSKSHLLSKGYIPEFELARMDYSSSLRMPERIYGRKGELEILENCAGRLFEGLQTNLFIQGESGVGKSKMVAYLKKKIISRKGIFVEGKFDQFNQNVPYSAVIECFEDLLDQLLKSKLEELKHLTELFKTELGQNIGVIVSLVPKAKLIFGEEFGLAALPPKESENRFRLTIRQFLHLFSKHVKPLTIFLDDIQWADPGTLVLARWLLENTMNSHTLFVCAYRSEVRFRNSYFEKWLMEVSQSEENRILLNIPPMNAEDVEELLSETLLRNKEDVHHLAETIFHKTTGNPYFISEILRQLSAEGIVHLVVKDGKAQWNWEDEKVNSLKITDNVVDLVISRTELLSPDCLEILCAASCINKSFDFNTIKELFPNKSPDSIAKSMVEAVDSELIFPLDENHRFILLSGITLNATFCFAHDRVQQALYSIQSLEATKQIHLQLARLGIDRSENPSSTLEIAAHYLIAGDLIIEQEEKQNASIILVKAGVIAKENNAPAAPFLDLAIQLFPSEIWQNNPNLAYKAYFTLAQSEVIQGNPQRAESLLESIETNSPKLDQQIAAISEKIVVYLYTLRFTEGIVECQRAFEILQFKLPEAGQESIGAGLGEVMGLLGGKNPADLVHLEPISEENVLLVNKMLYSLLPCAFLSGNGELWLVTVLEMTKILLTKGLSSEGAVGLSSFGMIMGAVIGDRGKALEIGETSIKITEKLQNQTRDPQIKFVTAFFLAPWVKNKDYFDPLLEESIADGLKYGDLGYTGFSIQVKYALMIFLSTPLSQFLANLKSHQPIVKTIGQEDSTILQNFLYELIRRELEEVPGNGTILGRSVDEWTGELMGKKLFNVLGIFLNFHCTLANIHGDYQEVINRYGLLSQLEVAFFSNLMVPAIKLQYFIAKSKIYIKTKGENPTEELTQLLEWMISQNQAENHFFKLAIGMMQAFLTWVTSGGQEAILAFESALKIAKETSQPRNVGIIQESLFQIYLALKNKEKAKSHFAEAIVTFNQYGASKKVHELKQEFPQLAFENKKIKFSNSDRPISTSETDLDYLSVIKSIQVLSAEIDIDTLLTSLLQICRENAGAQRGRYLKIQNGNFFIQSQIGDWSDIPMGAYSDELINFVVHSQESVVLDDATSDERFSQDIYFLNHSIKSVICVPIRFKQKLKGLVYLENNLAYGAFGKNIAEILRLLSTQMGISIENAELYTSLEETNKNLEQKVKDRTQQLSKLYSENEMLLLNMLPGSIAQRLKSGETFIADHYDHVSVMFIDIVNFTTISENLTPRNLVNELHSYFQTFDRIIGNHGLEKIKTIGDAYLAVSGLPKPDPEHAQKCILAAMEIISFIRKSRESGGLFQARVGISSGPLVAGVVGEKKFAFDIWGDTVNIAARMEQNSHPGKINLSGATYELVKEQISCTYRGKLPAKNKGEVDMYFVDF